MNLSNPNKMNTRLHAFATIVALASAPLHAQFDISQVEYWVGSGTDSSVLVVDFQDGSFDGQSFAWGYLHDGTATGGDMLNAIASADVNFTVNIGGGFLNDITYGVHTGIGGSPDYWSTWSGTDIPTMAMNAGISEVLGNGDWFGCSYTDFAPALEPTEPQAAYEPFRFTADDVSFWVGTGLDSAVVVVDFQDGSGSSSFAWGYLFNVAATGEDALNAIAAADPSFTVGIGGGFLNDIVYGGYSGIGGAPDYWGTWSGTNMGNWSMNVGISTALANGDLFGCSYTDFAPALRPYYPVAASGSTGIAEVAAEQLQVYPQPATEVLYLNTGKNPLPVDVFDIAGKRVAGLPVSGGTRSMDVSTWPAGAYVLRAGSLHRTIIVQ
jgi:hypothetical protein